MQKGKELDRLVTLAEADTLEGLGLRAQNGSPADSLCCTSSLSVALGTSHFSAFLNKFRMGVQRVSPDFTRLCCTQRRETVLYQLGPLLLYTLCLEGYKNEFSVGVLEAVPKRCPPCFSWHCDPFLSILGHSSQLQSIFTLVPHALSSALKF